MNVYDFPAQMEVTGYSDTPDGEINKYVLSVFVGDGKRCIDLTPEQYNSMTSDDMREAASQLFGEDCDIARVQ
jgi:hypothetical protein